MSAVPAPAPATSPAFHVRPAAPGDGRAISRLHHRSVRGLGATHYAEEILRTWAPERDEAALAAHAARLDEKIRAGQLLLVAESAGAVVGFGEVTIAKHELTAIYVDPRFARRGVGAALLHALERQVRARGLDHLTMDASLNAEAFYRAQGFEVVDYATHRLSNGLPMRCVRMRKSYASGA